MLVHGNTSIIHAALGMGAATTREGGHVLRCRSYMESTLGVRRTTGGEPPGIAVSFVYPSADGCMCVASSKDGCKEATMGECSQIGRVSCIRTYLCRKMSYDGIKLRYRGFFFFFYEIRRSTLCFFCPFRIVFYVRYRLANILL